MRRLLTVLLLASFCSAQNSSTVKNLTVMGTFVVSSSGLSQFVVTSVANDTGTGTTQGRLAKIVSGNTAVNATTTDTAVPLFPVGGTVSDARGNTVALPGKSGNAPLVWLGQANLLFDSGGGTVGHFVCISTIAAGNSGIASDCGAGYPAGQCWVGTLAQTVPANGTGVVNFIPGCNLAPNGYATIKNAGTGITARTVINWLSGINCVDNAITQASDCSIGTILAPNGSAAAPSISFANSTDTGFYRFAGGQIGFASGGALSGVLNSGGIFLGVVGGIQAKYAWCSDATCITSDTGLSRGAAGEVDVGNGNAGDKSGTLKAAVLSPGTGMPADAGGLKHQSVTTGSINASSSAAVTLTWGTAFADANYTPVCNVLEATASTSTLRLHHIESFLAASVTVRIVNDDGGGAHTGTLYCTGIHN